MHLYIYIVFYVYRGAPMPDAEAQHGADAAGGQVLASYDNTNKNNNNND